ncbi:MAG: hypothetical protein NVS3B15_14210 [Sediminibacterium sp.]
MMVVDTDGGGNIWFFAHARSNKVKDIAIDHHVQLIFAHPGKSCYFDVRGRAGVVYDKQSIKDKWTPVVKTWFPQGTDDPDLCLLKIKTDEAHYWSGENGGITEIFRIFTGKQPVAHGELHI